MTPGKINLIILHFHFNHFQTDGKLENLQEALRKIKAERVSLSIILPHLDESYPAPETISERLARMRLVVAKLRRQGIRAELTLPGMLGKGPKGKPVPRNIYSLYKQAAETKAEIFWIDGRDISSNHRRGRRNLLNQLRRIRRMVHNVNAQARIGFIAPAPDQLQGTEVRGAELAEALAGPYDAMMAQEQSFAKDRDRTEILKTSEVLSTVRAQIDDFGKPVELWGLIDNHHASAFHKSAEATQMQINLNLFMGVRSIRLDCFDEVGTAPGENNIYLAMLKKIRRFHRKIKQLIPDSGPAEGLRVVTAGASAKDQAANPWLRLLWRMGLPATIITAKSIKAGDSGSFSYVLTGSSPQELTRRQLNHIFQQGVLLDARAAATLEEMQLPGLLGVKVGKAIPGVQEEIIAHQGFAPTHYGYRSVLLPEFQAEDFRQLKPFHPQAKPITYLLRSKKRTNANGMILFDNIEHNHRCAILPYHFERAEADFMLSTERQQHLRDVLAWVQRGRLICFVENTPDLACFFFRVKDRKRLILALLNTGFDWAIDARIRLGSLPFAIKQVRELDEQGQVETDPQLQITSCRDYRYIQLTPDAAVPPMQMTILSLEG